MPGTEEQSAPASSRCAAKMNGTHIILSCLKFYHLMYHVAAVTHRSHDPTDNANS